MSRDLPGGTPGKMVGENVNGPLSALIVLVLSLSVKVGGTINKNNIISIIMQLGFSHPLPPSLALIIITRGSGK